MLNIEVMLVQPGLVCWSSLFSEMWRVTADQLCKLAQLVSCDIFSAGSGIICYIEIWRSSYIIECALGEPYLSFEQLVFIIYTRSKRKGRASFTVQFPAKPILNETKTFTEDLNCYIYKLMSIL